MIEESPYLVSVLWLLITTLKLYVNENNFFLTFLKFYHKQLQNPDRNACEEDGCYFLRKVKVKCAVTIAKRENESNNEPLVTSDEG